MNVKVTVDRIEGKYAVLLIRPEEEENVDWPIEFLPDDVEEGDILDIEINRDLEEKESAEERVEGLIEKLKNKK